MHGWHPLQVLLVPLDEVRVVLRNLLNSFCLKVLELKAVLRQGLGSPDLEIVLSLLIHGEDHSLVFVLLSPHELLASG